MKKEGLNSENSGVSSEKLGVSNEKLGVSNENLGVFDPMIEGLCNQKRFLICTPIYNEDIFPDYKLLWYKKDEIFVQINSFLISSSYYFLVLLRIE